MLLGSDSFIINRKCSLLYTLTRLRFIKLMLYIETIRFEISLGSNVGKIIKNKIALNILLYISTSEAYVN